MLKYLVEFQEALAVLIVLYVLIRYSKFIFAQDKISKNSQIETVI